MFKKENLTLEDQYQIDLNKKNQSDGSLIYVNMEYTDRNYFTQVLENLNQKLIEYNREYNDMQWNNMLFYSNGNSQVYYNKRMFNIVTNFHYKFFVDKEKMKITACVKHELIGGAYLLTLFYCFLNTPQKDINILFPKSSPFNFIHFLKFLYNYKFIPRINDNFLSLVNDKSEIKRYIQSYTIDKFQNYSIKSIILCNVMSSIYRLLNINRPLVCYLPIAFQHYDNVKNNIGLMWLTFDINKDDPTTIARQMYENRYQVPATNWILLNKLGKYEKSNEIRKSVDVVISFMLATEETEFKASWTYEYVSEYPVYVAISSIAKENEYSITQTITASTKLDNSIIPSFKEISLDEYKV